MDDGLVPISAQYSAGADAVYYGDHGHSDFSDYPDVTVIIADQVLRYIFGGTIATSTPDSGGTFEHHAGFLPFTYRWNDRLGETIGASGIISHTNGSLFSWETWAEIVGACSPGSLPASFHVNLTSIPLLTRLGQAGWASPADPTNCGLNIVTRAAPKSQVTVKWKILEHKPLPQGVSRDHYEITVTAGTPVVGITSASWLTDNLTDVRLNARSQAEGPFRWFKAEFRVFYQQPVQRKLIDDIAFQSAVIDP
jgi:hypothetical protein